MIDVNPYPHTPDAGEVKPPRSSRYIPTATIKLAVQGSEVAVLHAIGIDWDARRGHIDCPYADHGGKDDWRWDDKQKLAHCSCMGGRGDKRGHNIFDVVLHKEGVDFEAAKLRVAEIIGRADLIRENRASDGQRWQATDASSLLSAPAESRDDELPWRYLGARLGVDPNMVPRPATRAVGLKALGYYDPPASNRAKPKLVATAPCAIFETRDRDGRTHAHRIYLNADGTGKADLGPRDDGAARDPKKSAKAVAGDVTSGRSVLWGDAEKAPVAMLSEGVETGFAIALTFEDKIAAGEILVAACISAGGIEAFEPWPATRRVIVAADRDERSENGKLPSRRGERAGRTFAMRHHTAGVGDAALPVFIALPGQPSEKIDWLDVLRRDGIEAVRAGIDAAVLFKPTQIELDAARDRLARAERLKEIAAAYPLPSLDMMRLDYRYTKRGEIKVHRCDGDDEWSPVASPFGVPARLRRADADDAYGLRVVLEDMSGKPRPVDFGREELARMGGAEIKAKLFAQGLRVDGEGEAVVVQVLKAAAPKDELIVLSRPGWHRIGRHDPVFVAPSGEVIGPPEGQKLELSVNCRLDPDVAVAGTFAGWRDSARAAVTVSDCPHWVIGTVAAFAGPVLGLAGLDTCGVNLSGLSSSGKTLAQQLAVSAWSSPRIGDTGLFRSMRATENALESLAQDSNGTVLALDEMAHADGKAIGRMIYSIAGGVGKARMRSDATLRRAYSWSTFAILSGECSLEEKVRADGGQWMAGMAARFGDIDVTGINRAVRQSVIDQIRAIQNHCGHAGPAFVRALVARGMHRDPDAIKTMILKASTKLAGDGADSALIRAATPFAALLIAGSLAQQFDVVPAEANIPEAVRWAWERFRNSSDAAALAPDEQAIDNLRTWIAERWGVTIKDLDLESSVNNRETVAWFDSEVIYLPVTRAREAAGGVLKEQQIAYALTERKLLAKRHDEKRAAVRWVPKIGHVNCYALRRSEFGRTKKVIEYPRLAGHDE